MKNPKSTLSGNNNEKNKICKTHIKYNERVLIEKYLRNNPNMIIKDAIKYLSKVLCKHPKTIKREIQRGLVKQETCVEPCVFYKANKENLLYKGKRRKKNKSVKHPNRLDNSLHSIELRDSKINDRIEYGHWKGDTVVGGKGTSKYCLLTLTERITRQELISKNYLSKSCL